jgi:hypothetical protein
MGFPSLRFGAIVPLFLHPAYVQGFFVIPLYEPDAALQRNAVAHLPRRPHHQQLLVPDRHDWSGVFTKRPKKQNLVEGLVDLVSFVVTGLDLGDGVRRAAPVVGHRVGAHHLFGVVDVEILV